MKDRKFSLPSLKFGMGLLGRFAFPSFLKMKLPFPTGVYLGGGKLIVVESCIYTKMVLEIKLHSVKVAT